MTPDERAEYFVQLREDGLTYAAIALREGTTTDAVKNSIRRYNRRTNGMYTMAPANLATDAKIFVYDIETAPMNVDIFQLRQKGYISPDFVNTPTRMVCWAGRFLDGPMMFASEWNQGREPMLSTLFNIMDQADIIMGYNSDSFDNPFALREFAMVGLGEPTPYRTIDLLRAVRSRFKFDSYKLDFVAKQLLGDQKVKHNGYQMWKDVAAGELEARKLMAIYNKHDVELTEQLYYKLRPWIRNHPAVRYETDGMNCNTCGAEDNLVRAGWKTTTSMRYPLYQCLSCGAYSRTTTGGQHISQMRAA